MSNLEFSTPPLDFSKPLVTRSGKSVKILQYNLRGIRPVLGLVSAPDKEHDYLVLYFRNGRVAQGKDFEYDLQNKLIVETRDVAVVFHKHKAFSIDATGPADWAGYPVIKFSCDFTDGHLNGGRITQIQ